MAHAASQLKKNRDLEINAEEETEKKRKHRKRSRDRKKKVSRSVPNSDRISFVSNSSFLHVTWLLSE